MRICFALPGTGVHPSGGFRIVYEYANGLSRLGHEVTVLHPCRTANDSISSLVRGRYTMVYLARALGLHGGYKPSTWFKMDSRVTTQWTPSLHARWIPNGDVIIATAWDTAECVAALPPSKGQRYYLIQQLESNFGADETRVGATWKMPLRKIVVGRWLLEVAGSMGEKASFVLQGLTFREFGLDIPINKRLSCKIIQLYHDGPWKGSSDGIEALCKVRQQIPQLEVVLFGVPKRPEAIPDWMEYWQNPSRQTLRRLYNEAAIFVSPSHSEGCALPPCEAAQCGTALCLTDIGGHREYALNEQTALVSPPKNIQKLACNVVRLIQDNPLRFRLAENAHQYVLQRTWDDAATAFEEILRDGNTARE
jgi:hypothetical protein